MPDMKTKSVAVEMKANTEDRTFESFFSVFGNVDSDHDIVHPGAFKETIKKRFNKDKSKNLVRVLWQHDWRNPMGRPLIIEEQSKGAFALTKVTDSRQCDDYLAAIDGGAVNQMSFGFTPVKYDYDGDDTDEWRIRNLRKLDLWEYSPVSFPANEMAAILKSYGDPGDIGGELARLRNQVGDIAMLMGAVNLDGVIDASKGKQTRQTSQIKAATAYRNIRLAPRDYRWNATQAKG